MNTGHEIVINILYIQLNTKLLKIHTDFTYIIIKKKVVTHYQFHIVLLLAKQKQLNYVITRRSNL